MEREYDGQTRVRESFGTSTLPARGLAHFTRQRSWMVLSSSSVAPALPSFLSFQLPPNSILLMITESSGSSSIFRPAVTRCRDKDATFRGLGVTAALFGAQVIGLAMVVWQGRMISSCSWSILGADAGIGCASRSRIFLPCRRRDVQLLQPGTDGLALPSR